MHQQCGPFPFLAPSTVLIRRRHADPTSELERSQNDFLPGAPIFLPSADLPLSFLAGANNDTYHVLQATYEYRKGQLNDLYSKITSLAHANLRIPSSNSNKRPQIKTDLTRGDCADIAAEWDVPEPIVEPVEEANKKFKWKTGEWYKRHHPQ